MKYITKDCLFHKYIKGFGMKAFYITILITITFLTSINASYSQFQNYLLEENKLSSSYYQLQYDDNIFPKTLYQYIALWLSGDNIQADENLHVNQWLDKSLNRLLAIQIKPSRMPEYKKDGINGFPSLKFEGNTNFGDEDIITLNYNQLITTNLEFEDNTKKTLSIVFYCEELNRKQVIFEAGGAVSGFSIYIDPPDNIYFGMYKEWKKEFLKYKISPGLHLAQLEYDGSKFRGILDGFATDYKNFPGIICDLSLTGIGGSSTGTRFHDFATGVTCGYHFSGLISEIILMNDCNSSSSSKTVYDFLDKKYNIKGSYPYNWSKSTEPDDIDETESENQILKINNNNNEISLSVLLQYDDRCKIEIFDINGRLIKELFDGELKANFEYNFNINSTANITGIYFARLKGEKTILSKQFTVVK